MFICGRKPCASAEAVLECASHAQVRPQVERKPRSRAYAVHRCGRKLRAHLLPGRELGQADCVRGLKAELSLASIHLPPAVCGRRRLRARGQMEEWLSLGVATGCPGHIPHIPAGSLRLAPQGMRSSQRAAPPPKVRGRCSQTHGCTGGAAGPLEQAWMRPTSVGTVPRQRNQPIWASYTMIDGSDGVPQKTKTASPGAGPASLAGGVCA